MKAFYSTLAFGLGASAVAINKRQMVSEGCCFGINVSGGASNGPLGQLSDGQNRVGPGYSPATFCFNENAGSITDINGRGCDVNGAPMQYQCDEGIAPSTGITIDSNGVIYHNGSSVWYECAVTDNGVYNIYTEETSMATLCKQITLTTSTGQSCAAKVSTVIMPTTVMMPTTVVMPTTVSAPAPAAQTVTVSAPAPAAQTVTVSAPAPAAQTVTVSAPAPAAQTVTVSAPAPAAQTVTASCEASTVTSWSTVMSTITAQEGASTIWETKTVVSSAPAVTVTMTAAPSTVWETMTVTATQVQTDIVSSVATVEETMTATMVQTATVEETTKEVMTQTEMQTVTQQVSVPTTATVVVSTTQTAPTTVVVAPTTSAPATTSAKPTTSSSTSSSVAAAPTCPNNLSGDYQIAHLIVPVNSAAPSTAYGTQYNGVINSTTSTIFNFDIPSSYAGKTCDLIFTLPAKSLLETSDYTLTSGGSFMVNELSSPATQSTSYSNVPSSSKNLGTFPVTVGTQDVVLSAPCAAGSTVSYEFSAVGGLDIEFFVDYNPCPLGVFVTAA